MSGASYDVIVLGTGGVGSAALYYASLRAGRVLGLDRFEAGHDRGSSHGQTRIIRQAYFEHPDYVPLLLHAYDAWAGLESQSGRDLYRCTGLLEAGPADGVVAPGVLEADRLHGLGVETIPYGEAVKRFPAFRLEEDWLIVFEPQAGYLRVEDCVRTYIEQAKAAGAEHRTGVDATNWKADGEGFAVQADGEWIRAARLIVTAGAWAAEVLTGLAPPLRVLRKHLHWYRADAPHWRSEDFPAYLFETSNGCYYGFPVCDSRGAKIAEHSGGDPIDDPLHDARTLDAVDCERVERFIGDYLKLDTLERTAHTTCFYTNTPDDHFIVDRHPEHDGLVFAAGLSGHGFKFAPVLGQSLVQLAFDGLAAFPLDFLSLSRFAGKS